MKTLILLFLLLPSSVLAKKLATLSCSENSYMRYDIEIAKKLEKIKLDKKESNIIINIYDDEIQVLGDFEEKEQVYKKIADRTYLRTFATKSSNYSTLIRIGMLNKSVIKTKADEMMTGPFIMNYSFNCSTINTK